MLNPPILAVRDLSSQSLEDIRDAFYQHGVVLLRGGLNIDKDGFEDLTRFFCDGFHDVGTRQKSQVSDDKYTTEVFRESFILLGHTEGSYRQQPPSPDICFFMCIEPSCDGGQTTLVDGLEMLEALPASLRELFSAQHIRYRCSWDRARWAAELKVQSREALLDYFAQNTGCRYQLNGDHLDVEFPAKAIKKNYQGYPVFANSILSHLKRISHPAFTGLPVYVNRSNDVLLENGDSLPDDIVNILIDTHERLAYRHQWQKNDVLLIDNTRFMHGRTQAFDAGPRIIISRFGFFNWDFYQHIPQFNIPIASGGH